VDVLVERLLLATRALGLGASVGTLQGAGPTIVNGALHMPDGRRARNVVTGGHVEQAVFEGRTRKPRTGDKPLAAFADRVRYAP
jgi:hypothetical protein